MRSFWIIVAGLAIGWLPITVLDGAIPRSAIPYNSDALRSAVADGMSRAGTVVVRAGEGATARRE